MKRKEMLIVFFVFLGLGFCSVFPQLVLAEDDVQKLEDRIIQLEKQMSELQQIILDQTVSSGSRDLNSSRGWDPFSDMNRMQEEMDKMFQHSFRNSKGMRQRSLGSNLMHEDILNIEETKEGYDISFDMTGLDKEKVNIQINEHSITLTGEYSNEQNQQQPGSIIQSQSFGSFLKTIPLPVDADTSKVETKKEGGNLVIKLPKK